MSDMDSLALHQAMEAEMMGGLGISPRAAMLVARERKRERLLETLGTASGATLAAAAASALVTFAELLAAGLPREDRLAELAMLYRGDCPVGFLRESRFQGEVIRDPALPVSTARAVLEAKPSALEIDVLSRRKDLANKELQLAAVRGRARARWQGKSGGEYAALRCLPAGWLELAGNGVDEEIVGILRNPNCSEAVVRRYITCGTARVRLQALLATHRRGLAIESSLVVAARDLPMTDSPKFPRRDRVVEVANRILAAR
ncbi:hypothetical protein [Nocardioides zhouii]|uniref:Uncharacterized protein n=1 Tax=Nocardioides zhouii TaxID=1168729 RepID=A0A4Q2SNB6_9ACTN|nr:hypothetical protein [Nocardioides zhouii]RYC05660.1 hypothetical protein EUA94_18095 [Nocardioides zhouii]